MISLILAVCCWCSCTSPSPPFDMFSISMLAFQSTWSRIFDLKFSDPDPNWLPLLLISLAGLPPIRERDCVLLTILSDELLIGEFPITGFEEWLLTSLRVLILLGEVSTLSTGSGEANPFEAMALKLGLISFILISSSPSLSISGSSGS